MVITLNYNYYIDATARIEVTGTAEGTTIPISSPEGGEPTDCVCDDWVSVGCGLGGCNDGIMYQTRTCTPSGCNHETACTAGGGISCGVSGDESIECTSYGYDLGDCGKNNCYWGGSKDIGGVGCVNNCEDIKCDHETSCTNNNMDGICDGALANNEYCKWCSDETGCVSTDIMC